MSVRTYLEAISDGLRDEMRRDQNVILLGEDIATFGGAFKITRGFVEEFGAERVIDTPISESGFVGAASAAAIEGLRPVVEFQFADFIACAFDQIVNFAAKAHYRWGTPVPVVFRGPAGGGFRGGPFHSQNPEAWFTHVPGLKVVQPSTPYDAKGLLLESIFDDSPVMFFEHLKLYVAKGPVPQEAYRIPLGVAEVRRAGSDVTIVGISAMVGRALEAAEQLAAAGTSAEVIDPRTLSPLDLDTIVASVEKTGALVVVDESPPHCSVASEIAAAVSERAFDYLNGPVVRVTAPHAPVPFAPSLEDAYAPSVGAIVDAVNSLG